jgi:hypothetical protein
MQNKEATGLTLLAFTKKSNRESHGFSTTSAIAIHRHGIIIKTIKISYFDF